jgi:hypothetical protein
MRTTGSALPELRLAAQVVSARAPGEAASLANTWLRRLRARAPPLALALDDGLLALLERCQAAAAPPLPPGGAPAPEQQLPGGAAGPAMGPHSARAAAAGASDAGPAPPAPGAEAPGAVAGLALVASDALAAAALGAGAGAGADLVASDAMAAAAAALAAEAAEAAAERLWVEELAIGALHLLLDVHVSGASAALPLPLDTSRCAARARSRPQSAGRLASRRSTSAAMRPVHGAALGPWCVHSCLSSSSSTTALLDCTGGTSAHKP